MNAEERLFSTGDLQLTLQARQRRARQAVLDWDADQLLATAEAGDRDKPWEVRQRRFIHRA